jgi:hypothetical protein
VEAREEGGTPNILGDIRAGSFFCVPAAAHGSSARGFPLPSCALWPGRAGAQAAPRRRSRDDPSPATGACQARHGVSGVVPQPACVGQLRLAAAPRLCFPDPGPWHGQVLPLCRALLGSRCSRTPQSKAAPPRCRLGTFTTIMWPPSSTISLGCRAVVGAHARAPTRTVYLASTSPWPKRKVVASASHDPADRLAKSDVVMW